MKDKKEMMNEHDVTKKMLSTIRNNQKGVITEEKIPEVDTESIVSSTSEPSEAIDLTGEELEAEYNKFRETISPRVDFTEFKIYPQANNVTFSGKFQSMNGLEWQFSMVETKGLYIDADNLKLTDEVVETIQKLSGYYDVWVDEWANKLAVDYKKEKDVE